MQTAVSNTVEQPSPWERVGFIGGFVTAAMTLFATALFIAFIVPSMPPLDAPAAQVAAFYAAMSDNVIYRSVSYLGEAQMIPFMLFIGGLFGVLRRAERGSGALATTVLIAGAALSVITPIAIMLEDHLMLGFAVAGVEPTIVKSIDGMGPLAFALGGFPQVLLLWGTAALLLPQRTIPRWLGWFGYGLALMSLIGTGTLVTRELFPFAALAMLLSRVWVLALSLALLGHRPAVQPSVPRQVPA